MIQLRILSGSKAGNSWVARRFPVRIGRAPANDLQLEDPGVWDRHLELAVDSELGFQARTLPGATTRLGGQPAGEVALRNGDILELGSVKLQFWLAETRQNALWPREGMTWGLILLVGLSQVVLIYLLLR